MPQYTDIETFYYALKQEITDLTDGSGLFNVSHRRINPQQNEKEAHMFYIGHERFCVYQTHSGEYYWEQVQV